MVIPFSQNIFDLVLLHNERLNVWQMFSQNNTNVRSETSQTTKIDFFAKIVHKNPIKKSCS